MSGVPDGQHIRVFSRSNPKGRLVAGRLGIRWFGLRANKYHTYEVTTVLYPNRIGSLSRFTPSPAEI